MCSPLHSLGNCPLSISMVVPEPGALRAHHISTPEEGRADSNMLGPLTMCLRAAKSACKCSCASLSRLEDIGGIVH